MQTQPITKTFAERSNDPRLLVLSHVMPFPGASGQQRRVFYTLRAARRRFRVTFATYAPSSKIETTTKAMEDLCDELVILPSRYTASSLAKAWHRLAGEVYAWSTGLKLSNYLIGELELEPRRVRALLDGRRYDCALLEYWHAAESAMVLRERGIPCVLDMHNILWKSYEMQLEASGALDARRRRRLDSYREREERSWSRFDALVTINREERDYVERNVSSFAKTFFAPMGIDLAGWPYSWRVPERPRVAYYGGLASEHNRRGAELCAREIMPTIWRAHPAAELWIVGSNPPDRIRALSSDPRIVVTGFVDDVQSVLSTMSVVVCPWTGRYGFRSRLVEVAALGAPIVATPDAIAGMEFTDGVDLLLATDGPALAEKTLMVVDSPALGERLSRNARRRVDLQYSALATYDRLLTELTEWLGSPRGPHIV